MATIDESTFQAVGNANYKNNGEFGSRFAQSLAEDGRIAGKQMTDNLVMASNRFNSAMDAGILRITKGLVEPDQEEAGAYVKMESGIDKVSQSHILGNSLAQLSASIAGMQQYIKTAQSTPRETGKE